ncbi:MAG: DNA polymerase I [Burkholderiales bacterium]|nr:DNA polymerase I [Burkholderiales bacterium]
MKDLESSALLLIDGSNFVYRAFYAMPDLQSPEGKPTGAIRGIISMFKSLQKKYTTPHWCCVFDAPGKTFRDEIHPEYKAGRVKTPETLIAQLDDIYAIIASMGIPLIMQSGIEADDIIGTLAMQAKQAQKKVVIATGDKDFAQLVDDDIHLINTMTNEILDISGVIAKFGVHPKQIIDYLSLIGDNVDNIAGVAKCGPKTAVKWLEKYQTLDNIIANSHELTGVVGENLRQSISWLKTAKQLVTINTNVPIPQYSRLEDFICKNPDIQKLKEYYISLGFKTWLNELSVTQAIMSPNLLELNAVAPNNKNLVMVTSPTMLDNLIAEICTRQLAIGLLIIPSVLENDINLLALLYANNVYIFKRADFINSSAVNTDLFNQDSNSELKFIKSFAQLFASNVPIILPNAKETLQFLANFNLSINNIGGDLTLAHYLKNSRLKHSMSYIFKQLLQIDVIDLPEYGTKINKNSLWFSDDNKAIIDNCYLIAANILDLENLIVQSFTPQELYLYKEIEVPLTNVLVAIETTGFMIDVAQFKLIETDLSSNLNRLEDLIYQNCGCTFNINSPQQLQDILFNHLKLPTTKIKKNSNGYSTNEDTLLALQQQHYGIADLLLEYRSLSKLMNTYVTKLPSLIDHNQRIHTIFEQAQVTSGRLSSRDPNLQNIPIKTNWGKKIRQCFIAQAEHQLICVDYSQIELRILAHFAQDESLIKAFNHNQDIHAITASEIFHKPIEQISADERRYAKTINFSLLYGKTIYGLSQELNIDHATAKLYIEKYFAKYPKIKNYLDTIKAMAHTNEYVTTILGRKIYLPNINSTNKIIRDAEERLALNAPMQGTSADIIKFAMLKIDAWLKGNQLHSKIVLQIHDELILEVPNTEVNLIRTNLPALMTDNIPMQVQMAVEIKVGANWYCN